MNDLDGIINSYRNPPSRPPFKPAFTMTAPLPPTDADTALVARAILDAHLKRHAAQRNMLKEQLAAAFFAETGLLPSEAELCEQTDHATGTTRWWFQKRPVVAADAAGDG